MSEVETLRKELEELCKKTDTRLSQRDDNFDGITVLLFCYIVI